jgi:hypothetical protein
MGISRNQDRRRLEKEIQDESYQVFLWRLQVKEPLFKRFQSWADVIGFMHSISECSQKDEVLRPIFEAHYEDKDPRWRTILLVMFWPGLESLYWKKRDWDPDLENRWQNTMWAFLKTLCNIDVTRRQDRIVRKIFNDTIHRLYEECRLLSAQEEAELAMNSDEMDSLVGGIEDASFEDVEFQMDKEAEIKRLKDYMKEGRISEADLLLLLGTRAYGKSLADYSREMGLNYQATKKRRQRVEAALRRYEKMAK